MATRAESLAAARLEDRLLSRRLEVERVLVLSTAHLTEAEAQKKAKDWPVACSDWEYGFWVYVGDTRDMVEEGAHKYGGPECWRGLIEVARFAYDRGFDWVRFDCDADEIEGLTTYVW